MVQIVSRQFPVQDEQGIDEEGSGKRSQTGTGNCDDEQGHAPPTGDSSSTVRLTAQALVDWCEEHRLALHAIRPSALRACTTVASLSFGPPHICPCRAHQNEWGDGRRPLPPRRRHPLHGPARDHASRPPRGAPRDGTAEATTINRETSALHRLLPLAVYWGWLATMPRLSRRRREHPPARASSSTPEYRGASSNRSGTSPRRVRSTLL